MLHKAISGAAKAEVLFGEHLPEGLHIDFPEKIRAIADGEYRDKSSDVIRGSGYVVSCLEAALWCFHNTDNFRDAVLMAANLGDDADTTAAVCGQIAGAFYGVETIPAQWRQRLAKSYLIELLVEGLIDGRNERLAR